MDFSGLGLFASHRIYRMHLIVHDSCGELTMIKQIAIKSAKTIYKYARTFETITLNRIPYCKQLKQQNYELKQRLEWFLQHAEITTLKPATGYLRRRQLDALKFANEFFTSIADLNIKPFLVFGNLLGAYRHKGYIPWDDDLDFGLIREDYNKLIDYCKQNYYVEIYNGKWSEYSNDKHIARMDKAVKAHPNEYILDIWVDQLQITRGTSCIDRMSIDFWAYDYYADDYSIDAHMDYLNYLVQKRREIDYVDQIVQFLNQEIETNPSISKIPTTKVFSGIDNLEGYSRINHTYDWFYNKDLYPLKKVQYENETYFAPNNIERWLQYEYANYMSYPNDVGIPLHEGYKENYILHHKPTVEFYLIDAFEIYHFLPFYYYFEKNGIYSTFIAEPPEINTSKEWFDYDTAIHVLELNGVRYKKKSNYNVDFVFTTQDASLINKYKGKKIHLSYGVGLRINAFSVSQRTINGFDIKLVHGNYEYQTARKINDKIHIIKIGYPKYSRSKTSKYLYDLLEKQAELTAKNIHNKPILLYFPTWGSASTIDAYASQINGLREQFFIITKAHHCTYRLESENEHRRIICEISDIVLEGNFPFIDAALLGKTAICDAVSGAATEIPYLNPDIKLILLFSPIKKYNQYLPFMDKYAACIESPCQLKEKVIEIYKNDFLQSNRNHILKDLYESQSQEGFNELRKIIVAGGK